MRIKKKNVARLASISALGAGALGVAAGTAQASSIVYAVLPSNAVVGPDGKSVFQITFPPPGTPYFSNLLKATMRHTMSRSSNSGGGYWWVGLRGTGVQLRVQGSFLKIVSYGYLWGGVGAMSHSASIGSRQLWKKRQYIPCPSNPSTFVPTGFHPGTPTSSGLGGTTGGYPIGYYKNPGHWTTSYSVKGLGPFTNQYALFQFQDGGTTLYGWLELSNSVSPSGYQLGSGFGPNVTLYEYGYDTDGNPIMAGDTGEVPEPSTMALTGLAALALGATGLRRWRAARRPAA